MICRSIVQSVCAAIVVMAASAHHPAYGSDSGPRSYTDYRKEVVSFPLGKASFADRVVATDFGTKRPLKTERNPAAALGEPDFRKAADGRAYTLGCRGSITLEFTDNAVVDGPGQDLYVFEVGPDVEPTEVALSNDGENWTDIGLIAGGKASLDLAERGLKGRHFRFVRLTDTGRFCRNRWPGADIDAVGAISSAVRLRLESNVLFDFDQARLKPDADHALARLVERLNDMGFSRLSVIGHTDARGSDGYNRLLSERRAEAVATFLDVHLRQQNAQVTVTGRGEKEPVASNRTEEGRAANRRVEVIVFPE
ncbi:MAG: OmpA family protein [Pseudomonadota bacterium]